MNNLGFDNNNKKGRREHEIHQCYTCYKTFKTAANLACHKYDSKKGKVKCVAPVVQPNDGFKVPQQIISTNIYPLGSKSLANMALQPFTVEEKLQLQGNEELKKDVSLLKKQETSTSADTLEVLEKRLRSTKEWEMVYDIVQSSDYNSIRNEINRDFALSLMHQTKDLEEYPLSYLQAFTKAISTLTIRKLPIHLMQAFVPFVKNFKPNTEEHKLADLVTLFEFTKALGTCWEWLSLAEDKASIIIAVPAHCNQEISGELAIAFANEYQLHSSSFFVAFDNMMRLPGYQRQMHPYIDDFFAFVKEGKAHLVTCELMEDYRSFRSKYKDFDLRQLANSL